MFEVFWDLYPKKFGKDLARAQFMKELARGIPAETIVHGARQYRASSPGKYARKAHEWLYDGAYKEPQPETPQRKPRASRRQAVSPVDVALQESGLFSSEYDQ
ncbi:hypothetical protein [Microvirga sp. BSC39]|uniref:hypothetical protein n=1 Tax=Microvirga sp. BSC39 TaxID=1549810 RepID=UPI0004E93785|nr:hypothetical protein [Microvirga sp. BSC39]KFG71043.1 hypothetical protein JH26_00410 [Microvirga sp. BSC39]